MMTNKTIPAEFLLFDLDGTLIDSLGDLAASINLMLADLGRSRLSPETVGAFIGDGVRVLVYRSLTATHPAGAPPEPDLHTRGIELMHKHYAVNMLNTTHLYPNVVETLEALPTKRKALVTSKEVRFARLILDHFGIAKYFDAIVGGDTTPARKPDPRPVLEALRLLDSPANEAVMIGDSENDVIAGQKAMTRTCAVTFGYRTAEQLSLTAPDVIIDRFEQLQEVID